MSLFFFSPSSGVRTSDDDDVDGHELATEGKKDPAASKEATTVPAGHTD
jgi:hypothetical protein